MKKWQFKLTANFLNWWAWTLVSLNTPVSLFFLFLVLFIYFLNFNSSPFSWGRRIFNDCPRPSRKMLSRTSRVAVQLFDSSASAIMYTFSFLFFFEGYLHFFYYSISFVSFYLLVLFLSCRWGFSSLLTCRSLSPYFFYCYNRCGSLVTFFSHQWQCWNARSKVSFVCFLPHSHSIASFFIFR